MSLAVVDSGMGRLSNITRRFDLAERGCNLRMIQLRLVAVLLSIKEVRKIGRLVILKTPQNI